MAGTLVAILIVLAVALAVALWLFNALYRRSTTGRAFVRTGLGGEKVVISGGAFVLPVVHEVTEVPFALARAEIAAEAGQALLTRDRVRMDARAEVFLRVAEDPRAVSAAARTLGDMLTEPERLPAFFEGEFLGAMRAVAARMSMEEIHDDRAAFIEGVRALAGRAVAQSGLELRSIALRRLDQTGLEHFDPANRFDAEGLTTLIGIVEERRKLRNEIEQQAVVSIRERNLEAERETLALDRESEMARLSQEQEIELRRAEQRALIAQEQARQEAAARTARTEADARAQEGEIATRRAVEEAELAAREETERARLRAERETDRARVEREEALRRLEIDRRRAMDLAELESKIAVLEKAAEEAAARIETGERLAAAARAEEGVTTTREVEAAERDARVQRIEAGAASETERVRAAVAAEARRLRHEAENVLTEDARAGLLRHELIERLEGIVRETVKPMEKIDGIRIVHMGGGGAGGEGPRSPTDEVMDSVLRYRVQAPMIDEMLREVGVDGSSLTRSGDLFRAAKDAKSLAPEKKDG